jgi:3-methyladenine DNA glycosylase Mpg
MDGRILPRSFYDRDVVEVARDLLGKRLIRVSDEGLTSVRVAEVEAYLAADDREKLVDLARGPARLCEAMAIDRQLDGWDLASGQRLWIADDGNGDRQGVEIRTSVRIGVTSAHDLPLRFFLASSSFVSGPRRLR